MDHDRFVGFVGWLVGKCWTTSCEPPPLLLPLHNITCLSLITQKSALLSVLHCCKSNNLLHMQVVNLNKLKLSKNERPTGWRSLFDLVDVDVVSVSLFAAAAKLAPDNSNSNLVVCSLGRQQWKVKRWSDHQLICLPPESNLCVCSFVRSYN